MFGRGFFRIEPTSKLEIFATNIEIECRCCFSLNMLGYFQYVGSTPRRGQEREVAFREKMQLSTTKQQNTRHFCGFTLGIRLCLQYLYFMFDIV
jgi:hypothetical protein